MELFRLTNTLGLTHKTFEDLAAVGGVPPALVNAWVALEGDAEKTGSWVGLITAALTLSLVMGAFVGLAWLDAGSQLRKLRRSVKPEAPAKPIMIGPVPMPGAFENRHLLGVGTTGAGKSQLMMAILNTIRERNEPGVVVDRGGSAVARLARPTDYIINPFDRRSLPISYLADAQTIEDAESLAGCLFPTEGLDGNGAYFVQAAGLVFAQLLTAFRDKRNGDLWEALCDREKLAQALSGTPAEQYTANREWPSIFSTLFNRIRDIQHMPAVGYAKSFSWRKFIAGVDGTNKGRIAWIVLPYSQAASLAGYAATSVGIVSNAVLSLTPSQERAIWLITDELGNLPPLGGFSEAVTEGRKFGLRVVSFVQSEAQLRKKYGRDGAQTLLSCFSTRAMFRSGDAATAEECARHLSKVESAQRSKTTNNRTAISVTESERENWLVSPHEFLNLPDLTAYIKIGPYPHARVELPYRDYPVRRQPFLPGAGAAGKPPTPVESIQATSDAITPAQEAAVAARPGLDIAALSEIASARPDANTATDI